MAKREITLLTLATIILLVLASLFLKYRFHIKKVEGIVRKKESYEAFVGLSKKVRDIWSHGDAKGLLKRKRITCKQEFGEHRNIDPAFYQCNPQYLNCYFKEFNRVFTEGDFKLEVLPFSKEGYVKVITRSSRPGIKIPNYGVLLKVGVGEFEFPLVLRDSCHETLLPQRIYAYGPYKKEQKDWRWDNFGRLIMVDKHLVTKRDYFEWKNLENKKLKSQTLAEDLSRPVTDLLPGEMREYCSFRGKQVITALVYDASTFFPGDLKKTRPSKIFRSPYPWSRQKIGSFLWEAKRYADFEFKNEYCLKAYTLECLEKMQYSSFQFKSNSWIGISNVLGGKMQYMENPIDPSLNLIVSSEYYPSTSEIHHLGNRESWDEQGLNPLNLNLSVRPLREPKTYEIGFRCMRYLPNVK